MRHRDPVRPLDIVHSRQMAPANTDALKRLRGRLREWRLIKRVERYPGVKLLLRWLWYHAYPAYVRHVAAARVPSLPLVRLSTLARRLDGRVFTFTEAEAVDGGTPQVFPGKDRSLLPPSPSRQIFPGIFAVPLQDAQVTGATNLTLLDTQVICHDLYDFQRDFTAEELQGRIVIHPADERVRWLPNDPASRTIEAAASFVDACASNYAHWMTEVLPRINLFCSEARFDQVPIIVDDGLHSNLMESLKIVAGEERPVTPLPSGRALRISVLHLVSPTGYVPFDHRSTRRGGHSHGRFSAFALTALRRKLVDSVGSPRDGLPKQIYIRRNSGARLLVNAAGIEEILIARGFSIIEPEKLGFAEQVRLFSQAETVVGATGAALANLIFCGPSARIVVMIAKHEHMPYWYWQNIARSVGCDVRYVLGEMVRFSGLGIHGNFRVNPKDMLDAIE